MKGNFVVDITVHIDDKVYQAAVKAMGDEADKLIGQVLTAEAQIIMRESRRRVPIKDGVLRASGTVLPIQKRGKWVEVVMGYGGNAQKYAAIQHEKYPKKRMPGRTWHYLSDPTNERMPKIEQALLARMELFVARMGGG